ncbi:MAG: tetratricopeptide repeat protein [Holophagaceae bacterium]|nr:tetratricopeptide repeat protein [Holophagaceae bacterium]
MNELHPSLQHGLDLLEKGEYLDAALAFRMVLADAPEEPNALHLLGIAIAQDGRPAEAVPYFDRALALIPTATSIHFNRARTLEATGRLIDALHGYIDTLISDPTHQESRQALWRLSLYRDAPPRPLSFSPAMREGIALIGKGLPAQAVNALQRAVAEEPGNADAWGAIGDAFIGFGEAGEARNAYQKALSFEPNYLALQSSLLGTLSYDAGLSEDSILKAHSVWGTAMPGRSSGARQAWPNLRKPDRRLRVGYVGGDFRAHAVAAFFEPVLAAHDREAFEPILYANQAQMDEVSTRFKGLAKWVPIDALSDADAAARIEHDAVDVLVDLGGHTRTARLGVFGRRPAPVQVAWLGYPTTTGLPEMDYRITDVWNDPEDGKSRGTEIPFRLPRSFHCWRPPAESPEVGPLPAAANGHITFGCFNNLAKLTLPAVAAWSSILRQIPGSRLMLKSQSLVDPGVAEHCHGRFAAHGIEKERIQLLPFMPDTAAHLGHYNQIDIALDPFPYAGTTTTCEALWMGVPVLSVTGDRHASRVSGSLLNAVGLREFATADPDACIAKAIALASDLDGLAALRAGLRARMAASPLRNEATFTRDLESAFRTMWTDWCQGRAPKK